jgi:hypothetical protein
VQRSAERASPDAVHDCASALASFALKSGVWINRLVHLLNVNHMHEPCATAFEFAQLCDYDSIALLPAAAMVMLPAAAMLMLPAAAMLMQAYELLCCKYSSL